MHTDLKYDNPLIDPENDVLGRKRFSETLAKSIVGLDSSQGFVYGLYGPWGSGKSTVINFVEHYIDQHNKQENSETKIVVFRFNPWMFSGSENLTKVYLDQLRARLSMSDVSEKLQKVSKNLELIEQGLSFATPVANFFFPGSAGAIESIRSSVSSSKEIADTTASSLQRDLHHIKEEVTETLRGQKDKILVIIDDLDRLFDEEIRDFIKMIKVVCDFPKIVYLIACDCEKVAGALNRNKDDDADGYDYLEKIVQCSFNIPRPGPQKLYELFFSDLDKILEPLKNKELLFDETEWGNIFHDGVAPRLKTPRNVKTLINSIAACYPAVRDEVNVTDFVGIQTLRVFYPKAYHLVDHNKELLAGSTDSSYGHGYEKKIRETFYNQLHTHIPTNDLEDFKALMGRLFPKYAQIVDNGMGYGSDWSVRWKQHRKVCSEECFDLYFTMSIPEDSFTLDEMQSIIGLSDNPDELKAKLRSFIEADKETGKGQYKAFLQELENFTEKGIPTSKIKPLLQAIYDVSDAVGPDDHYRGFMDIGISMSMLRISYQLTVRFEEEDDRYKLLKEVFEKSESISMVVGEASLIDSKEQKEKDNIVTPEQAKKLIALALKRLKEFADDVRLPKTARFANSIYRWREWASEDEVKNYISELTKTDEGLVDFLTGFLSMSMSHGMSDRVVKKKYRVPHRDVLNFADEKELEEWVERARQIIAENGELQERQKKALKVFIDEKDHPKNYRD
jgi:predicted KAP-like P-loop ATPase